MTDLHDRETLTDPRLPVRGPGSLPHQLRRLPVTAPTPNAELAYLTLDVINAHRKQFEMDYWFDGRPDASGAFRIGLANLLDAAAETCGTTACYAGWAVALRGYIMSPSGAVFDAQTGAEVSDDVQEFAANLLGISYVDADYLFYVKNDEIDDAVAEFFGPRPATYGTGCRCDYLGENTPEHTPSPLCRSLRPEADRGGEPA